MKNSSLYKIKDLVDEMKKLDLLIDLHRKIDDDGFMYSQYETKKSRLMKELILELTKESDKTPDVFGVIRKIIIRFYPEETTILTSDLGQLAEAI